MSNSQTPLSSTPNTQLPLAARSPSQVPASSRQLNAASTQDIVSLKSHARFVDDRIEQLSSTVRDLQTLDEQSREKIEGLTVRLGLAEAQCSQLQLQLSAVLSAAGFDVGNPSITAPVATGPAAATSNDTTTGVPVTSTSPVKTEVSADIRRIASAALSSIYGVPKFTMKRHGMYPAVSKMHMDWPSRMDQGRRVPLHRFDFSQDYGSTNNSDSFETWITTSIEQGPALSGVTHLSSSELNRKSVTSECKRQFSTYKTQHKKMLAKIAGPTVGIKRKQESDDEANTTQLGIDDLSSTNQAHFSFTELLQSDSLDPEDFVQSQIDLPVAAALYNETPGAGPSDISSTNTAASSAIVAFAAANNTPDAIRSRKLTRCNMRTRKRPLLKGDAAKYKLPKYNTYFTPGAMSEEEDVIDEYDEAGKVKSRHLESHAYEWASDEMLAIRDTIDNVTDPVRSTKTIRRRGAIKLGPPHDNNSLDGGVRTWMVKQQFLDSHPEWLTQSLVYHSGAEWCEPEPSNVQGTRKVVKRIRTMELPGLELIQQAKADVLLAQAKVEEFNNSLLT